VDLLILRKEVRKIIYRHIVVMIVKEDLETKEEIITKIYGNYLFFINKLLER